MNLKQIEQQPFVNENAKKLAMVFALVLEDFDTRKCGNLFRSMVFAASETYKEDKNKIRAVLVGDGIDASDDRGPLPHIQRQKDRKYQTKVEECDGCPGGDNYIIVQNEHYLKDRQIKKRDKKTTLEIPIDPQTNPFASVEDILDRFEENAVAMAAFAQTQEIKLPGNVSKPRTIATYIFEHYQPEPEEEKTETE